MSVLRWPLQLVGGRCATVEAGSVEDAWQKVAMWAATDPGERPLLPGYGSGGTVEMSPSFVSASLALFEPGLDVRDVTVTAAGVDTVDLIVEVR